LRLGCGTPCRTCMAHRLVLWVVEAAHLMPMVALKEVRVYIQRDRNTTMTLRPLSVKKNVPFPARHQALSDR